MGALPHQALPVGGSAQLQMTAFGQTGRHFAVAPHAARWRVVSGSHVVDLTPDGMATGKLIGNATVSVTVNGLESKPRSKGVLWHP